MNILGIIIFIGLITWVVIDFKKLQRDLNRCPNCNQNVNQSWMHNKKSVSFPGESSQDFDLIIHKCANCGYSWNQSRKKSD